MVAYDYIPIHFIVVASFGTLSRRVSAGTEEKYEIIESTVFAAQLSAIFDFSILNTKSLHFLNAVSSPYVVALMEKYKLHCSENKRLRKACGPGNKTKIRQFR